MKSLSTVIGGLCLGFVLAGCSSLGIGNKTTVLFDGSNTEAFRAYKRQSFPDKGWAVQNGTLKTIPGGDVVDIITREKYTNFVLTYEWKVSPAGNSGIMYNVAETDGPSYTTGPEMQVLDDSRHPDGKNPKTSAGSLYALIAPGANKSTKPVGEFNLAKLVIRNGKVEHWLNGQKLLEYQWGSPEIKNLIAGSKFKSMPRFMTENGGHIAFQHHGEEVWYRNITITKLD